MTYEQMKSNTVDKNNITADYAKLDYSTLASVWDSMKIDVRTKQEKGLPDGAKSTLKYKSCGIYAVCDKGETASENRIMPDIHDVRLCGNGRVVYVDFMDGTCERAVLHEGDEYSLEQGVSICLMKKLLSDMTHSNYGSALYNKLVAHAIKVMNRNEAVRKKDEAEREEEKRRAAKVEAENQAWRKKCRDRNREEQIYVQTQAYLRAMEMWDNITSDVDTDKEDE